MSTIKEKASAGAALLITGKALTAVLSFVTTIVLARILIPEDFALAAIAITIVGLLAAFTELGLNSALVHQKDPEDSHFDTAWTLNMCRALILALILWLVAHPVANAYNEPRLVNVIYVLGISMLVGASANPKMVIFTRELSFSQEFYVSVTAKLLGALSAILVAFLFQSYWAILIGTIVAQAVTSINSYILKPYLPKISFSKTRDLFSFSVWLSLSSIVHGLNFYAVQLFVGLFLPRTQFGYFAFGQRIASVALYETLEPVRQVLFASFTAIQGDRIRLQAAYLKAQSILLFGVLPAGLGLALMAHPILFYIVGEKWLPAVPILQMLAIVLAIQAIVGPAGAVAMATGNTRISFYRDTVCLCVRIPLVVAGAYFYGLEGLLIAILLETLFFMYVEARLVRHILEIKITAQIANCARTLIAATTMAIVVLATKQVCLAFGVGPNELLPAMGQILIGSGTYFGVIGLLWWQQKFPPGPERELVNAFVALRRRMSRQSGA